MIFDFAIQRSAQVGPHALAADAHTGIGLSEGRRADRCGDGNRVNPVRQTSGKH